MELGKVSTYLRNPNTRAGRLLYGGVSGAAALALFASGCGADPNHGLTDPTTPAPAPKTPKPDQEPQLTFDYLGGGSTTIKVFPGPGTGKVDGTYFDGDTVGAICKTEGQERKSDPSLGEEPRHSDEWIKIDGTPGETQFATAVYIEHPQQLLDQLPDC